MCFYIISFFSHFCYPEHLYYYYFISDSIHIHSNYILIFWWNNFFCRGCFPLHFFSLFWWVTHSQKHILCFLTFQVFIIPGYCFVPDINFVFYRFSLKNIFDGYKSKYLLLQKVIEKVCDRAHQKLLFLWSSHQNHLLFTVDISQVHKKISNTILKIINCEIFITKIYTKSLVFFIPSQPITWKCSIVTIMWFFFLVEHIPILYFFLWIKQIYLIKMRGERIKKRSKLFPFFIIRHHFSFRLCHSLFFANMYIHNYIHPTRSCDRRRRGKRRGRNENIKTLQLCFFHFLTFLLSLFSCALEKRFFFSLEKKGEETFPTKDRLGESAIIHDYSLRSIKRRL